MYQTSRHKFMWLLLLAGVFDTQAVQLGFEAQTDLSLAFMSAQLRPLSLAFVSAQFGAKDKVEMPIPDLPEGVQGFFFTDSSSAYENERRAGGIVAGAGWNLVTRAYHSEQGQTWSRHNTHGKYSLASMNNTATRDLMTAKFYKVNAHLLPELQNFDMIFWMDASHKQLKVIQNSRNKISAERAAAALGDNDFLISRHEDRTTVKSEIGAAASRAAHHSGQKVTTVLAEMEQFYELMTSQGFKDDFGLFRGDMFLYRARSPAVRKAMADWWGFIQDYAIRDQLSLPWALEVNKVNVSAPCQARNPRMGGTGCILSMF